MGGISRYGHMISDALVQKGHYVHIISSSIPQDKDGKEYNGKKICLWRTESSALSDRIKFFWRINNYFPLNRIEYSELVRRKIEGLTRRAKIDLIEFPNYEATVPSMLKSRGISVVVRIHSPSFMLRSIKTLSGRSWSFFMERLEASVVKKASAITAPSKSILSLLQQRINLSNIPCYVIPNPIDVDFFSPPSSKTNERLIVLYVGRFEYGKGIHILGKAIKKVLQEIPNVYFVLAGGLPYQDTNYVNDIIREYKDNDRVTFLDAQPCHNLLKLYRQANLLVIPSLYETFSYSCIEAMACGLPVIASNVGGLTEIIENGKDGILVPKEDAEKLAEEIISLLTNEEKRTNIGKMARDKAVKQFSLAAISGRVVEVYRSLIR